MDWLILGLMAGSLYAIVMGPAGLDARSRPSACRAFDWLGFILGICLLLGLEALRRAQTPARQRQRELRASSPTPPLGGETWMVRSVGAGALLRPLQTAPQEGNTYQKFSRAFYSWQKFYGN